MSVDIHIRGNFKMFPE